MTTATTFALEDQYMAPFFVKQRVSIARGEGVYVWDEEGNQYIDFTSGWGVTCIGHAQPVITEALCEQAGKIIQNPNSGLTYSPARARLLALMREVLPSNLTRLFFTNSGAEANDAVIKLARKVTKRTTIISTEQGFHGRTLSTLSATGQAKYRKKFDPIIRNHRFLPYGDIDALAASLDRDVAAVILEPVQGEGGVNIPPAVYLAEVSRLCQANGTLLIVDEIQTGFCRTGPMFVSDTPDVKVDFLTMAKGLAGGFPFGAFAVSEEVAQQFDLGDHGGTYCGNPLGCAVTYAVIKYLVDNNISAHVECMGNLLLNRLQQWQQLHPELIIDVRGAGLLVMIEFKDEATAHNVDAACAERGLFVRQTQGSGIRIFPALNITEEQLNEGLTILESAILAEQTLTVR